MLKTYDKLQEICDSKGYVWFPGAYDLNVIGVRSANRLADSFDDHMYVCYKDVYGSKRVFELPITSDPGLNYLKKPATGKGCAILVPGQYRAMWRIGMHQGKYRALVQRGVCTVFRDNNRDAVLDYDHMTTETGLYGINFHYMSRDSILESIGNGSAGCQVSPVYQDHSYVMSLVDLQVRYLRSDAVTYTLLCESEVGRVNE